MTHWAIISGIEGNLAAYKAVEADIKRQISSIEAIYILGDLVGPHAESEKLISRVLSTGSSQLTPQICKGWWEEQCLVLHGVGTSSEPTDLIQQYGSGTVKTLWDCVSKQTVEWIRSLDMGFLELDCLLIHGSTLGVDDQLTPETPPLIMLDRLGRMGANHLFCGRSGQAFQYEIKEGCVSSTVTTLDAQHPTENVTAQPRQVIGVGNVGRTPGQATYTLYNPYTNKVEFRTIHYGSAKGFQVQKSKVSR